MLANKKHWYTKLKTDSPYDTVDMYKRFGFQCSGSAELVSRIFAAMDIGAGTVKMTASLNGLYYAYHTKFRKDQVLSALATQALQQ